MSEPDYIGHRKRLKERFMVDGGKSMQDYELLELDLMMAIPRRDVKPLAKKLIKHFGDYAGVITAPIDKLRQAGVSENTIIFFNIIKESAVRMSWQALKNSDLPIISNHDVLIDYLRTSMAHQDREEFRILFLNSKLELIGEEIQQRGTVDQVAVHPREVINSALAQKATSIILAHNHPSGRITPSNADITITKNIKTALEAVNIHVHDHIIISKSEHFSFKNSQIL